MPNTNHDSSDDREINRDVRRVESSETANRVRAEIEALHEFFVSWFTGAVENDDDVFQRGFARRFDPGFVLVPPAGTLMSLPRLTRAIREGYGQNPDFRIAIREVVLRREIGDLVLVTYEEWQRNAKASTPADNGRAATAVFKADRVAPGGLAWLHVHECWLPREVMAAGPYDF
ncbi:hypothetical protein ENSA5_37110 [Enhygromyxa salina]|uniref:Sucrose-phosphatase C-terminal domain-containing protein n=1 Tax=Enhygromyxa salina TaxID=215803 RepID=A0A2S9XSK1_9BACT|nr:hypothetical protein [Enhygromyxa salina]PRP95842.1 hypothetical protein ENSA5_37110 [Enhygromyxa salina]